MSVKPKKFRLIVLAIIGISIVGFLASSGFVNTCGIEHVAIVSEINTYEKTLDPEFCENLTIKIMEFNESCEPYVEILDCG